MDIHSEVSFVCIIELISSYWVFDLVLGIFYISVIPPSWGRIFVENELLSKKYLGFLGKKLYGSTKLGEKPSIKCVNFI